MIFFSFRIVACKNCSQLVYINLYQNIAAYIMQLKYGINSILNKLKIRIDKYEQVKDYIDTKPIFQIWNISGRRMGVQICKPENSSDTDMVTVFHWKKK